MRDKFKKLTETILENYIKSEEERFDGKESTMLDAGRSEKARKEAELIKESFSKTGE